jgi:hypothetical protein
MAELLLNVLSDIVDKKLSSLLPFRKRCRGFVWLIQSFFGFPLDLELEDDSDASSSASDF